MPSAIRSFGAFRSRRSVLRAALLATLAVGVVSQTLIPTAHAQETEPTTQNLNECYFDGARHTRNFGNTDYGSIFIYAQKLKKPLDGYGPRPIQVAGTIMPGLTVGNRGETPQPSAGFKTGGESDVDPGHVMALHLGGPDNPLNIVPQWAKWQRLGDWRKMEQELHDKAKKIADDSRPAGGGPPTKSVSYNIAILYRDTGKVTPSITGWAFPKTFIVSACPVKLSDPGRCDGDKIFDNKKFEGGPPTDQRR